MRRISRKSKSSRIGITKGGKLMITFKQGDLFREDVEALVNTVNCVGVMGRGVALQFKKAFPDNFKAYANLCARKEMQPGRMFIFETGMLGNPRYIINFPTKRHWRGKSRIEDIEFGLTGLRKEIIDRDIKSIALPPLGAGLGGLPWAAVRNRIEQALGELEGVEIIAYEPIATPTAAENNKSRDVPPMTPGRAALVSLMDRYLAALLEPFVSLLEIHKLMYFLQEAGEPLRLKYKQALFGPYAENLRHVLNAVEGHLVSGYADGGDAPDKLLELVPGAVNLASDYITETADTKARLERVADLFEGFESSFGLELLSTVHWVMKSGNAATAEDVISAVYAWNDRKQRFTPEQIRLAIRILSTKGWAGTSAQSQREIRA